MPLIRPVRRLAALFLLVPVLVPAQGRPAAPGPRTATLLHFNDVYEITPVEGGRSGGLARVAALRDQLRRAAPGLVTVLGGDFLSPSALGLATIDGRRFAGEQMVAVLNRLGLDWAVFGNHEFDVREEEFRARLAESRFRYVASNVTDSAGRPFPRTSGHAVVRVAARGGTLRLGLLGLVIDDTRPAWTRFEDPFVAAQRELAALADSGVDAVVALTHLTLAQDQELAERFPALDLILGGHEHENYLLRRGPRFTPIVKADANVRTVAVIALTVPRRGARASVDVRFVRVDDSMREDPAVAREVSRWVAKGDTAFRADGLEPRAVVTTLPEPLDGRESSVRVRPGRLPSLIAAALQAEVPGAEVGLMNGGSIRIDDVIPTGPITQYDVVRILPFGGKVSGTTMPGSLLQRVLDQGEANRGSGGYLHAANVTRTDGQWFVAGRPLDPARRYVVATTDFLLTGREKGLGFLAPGNGELGPVTAYRDIRKAVIDQLQRTFGPPR